MRDGDLLNVTRLILNQFASDLDSYEGENI